MQSFDWEHGVFLDATVGSEMNADRFAALQAIHPGEWQRELEFQDAFFAQFNGRLPDALTTQQQALRERIASVPAMEPGYRSS